MVIKSEKLKNIEFLVLIIGMVLCIVLSYSSYGSLSLLFLIPFIYILRCWIAIGRTLTMDQQGITVSVFLHKKSYSWSELKTKRYAEFENAYGYRDFHSSGAEFSLNMVHRPKWLKPQAYCSLAHPISFCFVYFRPKLPKGKHPYYRAIYAVDEAEFRAKLDEWGVQMDNE